MNNEFNMFHYGQALSPLVRVCMKSFIDFGHVLNAYLFQDLDVPAGVRVLDANNILPREELFLFHKSPSAFSNIFRYKLLLENGGWWVDTDVLCLTDSIPDCEYAWAQQDPDQINGAILKFPAGDKLCAKLLRHSLERAKSISTWGQLGPGLLTDQLPSGLPPNHFGSRKEFYPTHWVEAHMCWMEGESGFIENKIVDSMFLHMWSSVLVKMKINLNSRPPRGSYFEKLIPQYLFVDGSNSELKDEVLSGIRSILDYKPTYKLLYQDKLGLDWKRIYPESD